MGLTQHAHGVDTIRRWSTSASRAGCRAARIAASCRSAATPACRAAPRSAACRPSTPRRPRAGRRSGASRAATPRLDRAEMVDAAAAATSTSSGSSAATSSRRCPTTARTARALRAAAPAHPPGHRAVVDDARRQRRRRADPARRRRATSRRAAAPRPRPSGASSSRPRSPGRRIGSARPEWEVFGEAMARAFPDRADQVRFASAAAIRDEIARAVPLYAGIETLTAKGDQVQWGGPHALRRRPLRHARRQGAFRGGRRRASGARRGRGVRARGRSAACSASPPGAASSSTRWSSARSIR